MYACHCYTCGLALIYLSTTANASLGIVDKNVNRLHLIDGGTTTGTGIRRRFVLRVSIIMSEVMRIAYSSWQTKVRWGFSILLIT